MRIAFLILNHRAPEQLLRLIVALRLELPDSPIVVHNDKFSSDLGSTVLDSAGNVFLLTSDQPVSWGDFSLVEVCWRSMAWMHENIEFDWLIMLSGQDYPIRPLAALGADLAATGADMLLDATPIGQLDKKKDRTNRGRRYFYQYRPAPASSRPDNFLARSRYRLRRHTGLFADILNNVQPFFQVYKFSAELSWRVGWRARRTPFTPAEPCWFGSMWLTLSRRAAGFVVASLRDRPDYVDYYRRTAHPDESAIATLICNAPWARIERRDLHYVRWTRPDTGHPDILLTKDLPELRASSQYFARKFDIAKDVHVLDELDNMLAKARVPAVSPIRAERIHIAYLGNHPGLHLVGQSYREH